MTWWQYSVIIETEPAQVCCFADNLLHLYIISDERIHLALESADIDAVITLVYFCAYTRPRYIGHNQLSGKRDKKRI